MKSPASKTHTNDSPSKQVDSFIRKFDPAIAKLARSVRREMRKRFPSAVELVYDNYNALAIGFGPTERASDAIFSVAVYARGVSLYFMYGRSLPDPLSLLQGQGNQGAFIRIENLDVLKEPGVKSLLEAAIKHAKPSFPEKGRGYTVIKSISAKQRPRRPSV